MSAALTSDYSMTVKNNSSVTFTLFHAAEGGGKPKTHSRPANSLTPGATTVFAWDSTAGQVSSETCVGHMYYSPVQPGPPCVWGIQMEGYTPQGGRPKTKYQYADAANPYSKGEPGPPFWLESGKGWGEDYEFVIPSMQVKIRVANDPHEREYESTGKPLYSVAVIVEDYHS
ncbi:hypothetical protein R3P38DRAFT_2812086 [Favolaschia claudopus]|uniref:Uncharacterized protein n=1 Tax=Favolaschia claudopus TaxID=2862362 RepID=A0AAV9Z836_9AGAR